MILGGSDTSAVTVEWTMSELIKHPRVMEKVQKEVKEMFDGKRTVDEADLDELHYLDMVIKESLRLHPPAPLIAPRECRETTVINGYHIPAKTRIIVNAWAMKRDPRHWNEPTEFYPERFFDTSIDYNGQNFKFIPFGAGRRIYPGIPLIVTSCVTILMVLMRRPKPDAPLMPPGPRKLPLLGNLHNLMGPTLPHRRLMELAVEHGPLIQLQLGETSTVVVSSPELAKEFLQTHDLNFATRPFLPSAAILLYNGRDIVFGPFGDYWRQKLKKLHAEADAILEQVINEHVARIRTDRVEDDDEHHQDNDLVDVFLNLNTKNHGLGFSITHVEIKAVILDLFLGGSDTSAVIVEWAMSELMKHPRVMEKVQKEVRKMFDAKLVVDEADLDELHYLDMVIKETLRLHAPAPLISPRECRETTMIGGYEVQAKTRVIVNAWAINRDPRHWEEPTEFCPERFIDTYVDYNGQNFKFIPFGAGRRVCPGIQSGMAMVKLLLAKLLYNFDWKLPNENNSLNIDMSEEFGLTVKRKNELFLIPVLRHPQPQ
ncbi:unnamed protein product [Linum tenue]|uniref:Cytochrome P450 n=1 Tax=Linum tenue TaxID=586396 RepID=A0AAV0NC82_9ROSI|nr:unnamed protein product [Linum tenue]